MRNEIQFTRRTHVYWNSKYLKGIANICRTNQNRTFLVSDFDIRLGGWGGAFVNDWSKKVKKIEL